jgi:hypothetical protein
MMEDVHTVSQTAEKDIKRSKLNTHNAKYALSAQKSKARLNSCNRNACIL